MAEFKKDDTILIQAVVEGVEVEEEIRFNGPVSIEELANIKVAWEAGVKRGLAAASNTESRPE